MKKKLLFISLLFVGFQVQSQCWETLSVKSGYYTTGIRTDGSLWTWGLNWDGQLGDGTTQSKSSPVNILPEKTWIYVAATFSETFAIDQEGALWGWGKNQDGQLGIGNSDMQTSPIQIGVDTDWAKVFPHWSSDVNFAIKQNGTLWAWGKNNLGQIGDGTIVNRPTPIQVGTDTDWIVAASKGSESYGIKTDGTFWVWGQIRINNVTNQNSLVPIQFGTDTNWVDLKTSTSRNAMAIKSDGTLWAWGFNDDGQLGIGDENINHSSIPVQVGTDTNWVDFSVGYDFSVGLKSNGTVWGWGQNDNEQTGQPNTNEKIYTPHKVSNINNAVKVQAGYPFAVALSDEGTYYAWGLNNHGAFGIGSEDPWSSYYIPFHVSCTGEGELSIDDNKISQIKLYPNPTQDYFSLESNQEIIDQIEIININGQLIKSFSKQDYYSISDIQNGIYFVKIKSDGSKNNSVVKLIKN